MSRAWPAGRAGTYERWGSYQVFIPRGLPPAPPLTYDDQLIGLLNDASRALGKVEGLASVIANPGRFMAMYVRKEALLSSQIEGTRLLWRMCSPPRGRILRLFRSRCARLSTTFALLSTA